MNVVVIMMYLEESKNSFTVNLPFMIMTKRTLKQAAINEYNYLQIKVVFLFPVGELTF